MLPLPFEADAPSRLGLATVVSIHEGGKARAGGGRGKRVRPAQKVDARLHSSSVQPTCSCWNVGDISPPDAMNNKASFMAGDSDHVKAVLHTRTRARHEDCSSSITALCCLYSSFSTLSKS